MRTIYHPNSKSISLSLTSISLDWMLDKIIRPSILSTEVSVRPKGHALNKNIVTFTRKECRDKRKEWVGQKKETADFLDKKEN